MTGAEKLAIVNEKYVFATRIPSDAFLIEEAPHYQTPHYVVKGKLSALPPSFCTVDQICVSNGEWREVFDDERLERSYKAEVGVKNVSRQPSNKIMEVKKQDGANGC